MAGMDRDPSDMADELATLARPFGDRVCIAPDGAVTIERQTPRVSSSHGTTVEARDREAVQRDR